MAAPNPVAEQQVRQTASEPATGTHRKGQHKSVALAAVFFDHTWNPRQGKWREQSGEMPDGSEGVNSLVTSIRAQGQKDPIDVRSNPFKSKAGHPGAGKEYMAIDGHRRGEAIRRIAEEDKNASPTIRVQDWGDVSDADAFSLAVTAGVDREELEMPDLVMAARRLHEEFKLSGVDIARRIGRTQGYAAQLLKIAKGVKVEILKKWQEEYRDSDRLTLNTMVALSEVDRSKQDQALKDLLEAKKEGGKGDWLAAACKRAEAVGATLGSLEREFHLPVGPCKDSGMFTDMVEQKVGLKYSKPGKEAVTKAQKAKIVKALTAAYIAALTKAEAEEQATQEQAQDGGGAS